MPLDERPSVAVLSGFLAAGKTTPLNRLLDGRRRRVALIGAGIDWRALKVQLVALLRLALADPLPVWRRGEAAA